MSDYPYVISLLTNDGWQRVRGGWCGEDAADALDAVLDAMPEGVVASQAKVTDRRTLLVSRFEVAGRQIKAEIVDGLYEANYGQLA